VISVGRKSEENSDTSVTPSYHQWRNYAKVLLIVTIRSISP
jgi:hypothetical protein